MLTSHAKPPEVSDAEAVESTRRVRLGRAIQARRKELGLTQEDLAGALGVHKMTVVKYEAGQVSLPIERLVQVARALKLTLNYLLLEAGFALVENEQLKTQTPDGREIRPDAVAFDPSTGKFLLFEFKDGERYRPDDVAELRRIAEARGATLHVVDSNDPSYDFARAIRDQDFPAARNAQQRMLDVKGAGLPHSEFAYGNDLRNKASEFSRAILVREKEVELELFRMGATADEVAGFSKSLRGNPLLVAAFSGGAPVDLGDEQVLQLFEGAALGYKAIVKMLIEEREKEAHRR